MAASPIGKKPYKTNKKFNQQYVGKTTATIIYDFLENVKVCEKDNDIGYIDIEYIHSRRTAALVDAGWLTGGWEYAYGADPFQLPKPIRNSALRRFGLDFDDEGSYPRAILRACPVHKGLGTLSWNTVNSFSPP